MVASYIHNKLEQTYVASFKLLNCLDEQQARIELAS